jgi:hypothetical protein
MPDGQQLGVVLSALLPDHLGDEILLPEYLVAQTAQIADLGIVDADEDDALIL